MYYIIKINFFLSLNSFDKKKSKKNLKKIEPIKN